MAIEHGWEQAGVVHGRIEIAGRRDLEWAEAPAWRWRRAGSGDLGPIGLPPATGPDGLRAPVVFPTGVIADRRPSTYPRVEVALGMVVEDRSSGFVGDIVKWNAAAVTLRDRRQHQRHFTWKPGGFLYEGQPVTLVQPRPQPSNSPRFTASGAIAGPSRRSIVARASRIWVEGRHDAELVEHVWGDELRELGIVVEPMHGADDLAAAVRGFRPGPQRRLGVVLDHLVEGSKEWHLASEITDPFVMVTGHPYVDVWAAIRPRTIGIKAWPTVATGRPWKEGVCEALGQPFDGFWPRVRNRVQSYVDLEPELVGAIERLIDFVSD
ncbi:MAG: hypothetical protein CSA55_05370 [Ilumatobacter coccineus]|uniref:DUF3097 domain-containing protein n=1 Tax=Ilumatobacter coccineus TaxID=467094 RepID=A0A2G6K7G3_9ACTN|nr:MAG: hypothetical protein CSA55_05370 [Ilumatobacter coccineus]